MTFITDPGRGSDQSAQILRRTGAYRQILAKACACAVPKIEGNDISPTAIRLVKQARMAYGVLSTGERLAVALVLNRPDWLQEESWTLLDAVSRVGDTWLSAAILVHRDGWDSCEQRWRPEWVPELKSVDSTPPKRVQPV